MSSIDLTELFIRTIADVAIGNEKYFADLDGVCGDGDFGISLASGFSKVMEQWDALDHSTPGALLKGVSMTIASRVGGVSGAIWGTAFLRASVVAGTKTELTIDDIAAMLTSAPRPSSAVSKSCVTAMSSSMSSIRTARRIASPRPTGRYRSPMFRRGAGNAAAPTVAAFKAVQEPRESTRCRCQPRSPSSLPPR